MLRAAAVPDERSDLTSDLVWIAGGRFRVGSERHYAEEAPAHRVTVDGFWRADHLADPRYASIRSSRRCRRASR
jgi:formylglycine-generating enzyme required for sulfatase activity